MDKKILFCVLGVSSLFLLSGCVVRSYELTRDRVDQGLSGNRGYLQGQVPANEETKERKTTRTVRMVEVEMHSPIKFEKAPNKVEGGQAVAPVQEEKTVTPATEEQTAGNRGYLLGGVQTPTGAPAVSVMGKLEKYTVVQGDTLQKISQKVYGTTKKWHKIFEANKDTLKAPDKIYAGEVLDIPADSQEASPKPHHRHHGRKAKLNEPSQNLK